MRHRMRPGRARGPDERRAGAHRRDADQLAGRLDRRQAIAAALLAGRHGDAAPMLRLGGSLGLVQADHAAPAQDRHDARHAELRRLLHDDIHAVGASDALYERDVERRFAVDGAGSPTAAHQREPRMLSTAAVNSRPSPVNNTIFITASRAEYLGEMLSGRRRKLDQASGAERRIDVYAVQPHARRSAIAAADSGTDAGRSYGPNCRICYSQEFPPAEAMTSLQADPTAD